MAIEKIKNHIKNGIGSGVEKIFKEPARDILQSKTGGEFLSNALLKAPAKSALNIFGISAETGIKIAGTGIWEALKFGGKALLALPLLPAPAKDKERSGENTSLLRVFNQMFNDTRKDINDLGIAWS